MSNGWRRVSPPTAAQTRAMHKRVGKAGGDRLEIAKPAFRAQTSIPRIVATRTQRNRKWPPSC